MVWVASDGIDGKFDLSRDKGSAQTGGSGRGTHRAITGRPATDLEPSALTARVELLSGKHGGIRSARVVRRPVQAWRGRGTQSTQRLWEWIAQSGRDFRADATGATATAWTRRGMRTRGNDRACRSTADAINRIRSTRREHSLATRSSRRRRPDPTPASLESSQSCSRWEKKFNRRPRAGERRGRGSRRRGRTLTGGSRRRGRRRGRQQPRRR